MSFMSPCGISMRLPKFALSGISQPMHIALVEDDDNLREALVLTLTMLDYTVVEAPSGAELLSQLGTFEPDFILTDYRLGGGQTGLDVIAAVRAILGKDFPAAVLTGDTDSEVASKIVASGVTVLRKPITLETLDAVLGQRRAS